MKMSVFTSHLQRVALVLCAVLILSGCDFSGDADRTVSGVSITELFTEPTETEIETIREEWEERDVSAQNFDVITEADVALSNGDYTVSVVSHTVEGVRHVGAFVVPQGVSEELPVLVHSHGGDAGVSVNDEVFSVIEAMEEHGPEFIYVVPSFRSEDLRLNDLSFPSNGDPSPWDRDVDDALALLNAALEEVPQADENRIGVLGFSRGATVGKLMAVRDERIDAVVSFFGPTDFYGTWAQGIVEDALQGTIHPLPGVEHLVETYILPLQEEQLTIEEVRPEMTRRSIVFFVEDLPAVQLHHGEDDEVVPVSEATQFRVAMERIGETPSDDGDVQYFLYPSAAPYDSPLGHHTPEELPESIERTVSFLTEHLLRLPTEDDQ